MKNCAAKLMSKIEKIQSKYDVVTDNCDTSDLDVNDSRLFGSMQRWHENAHVSEEEWLRMFDKIKIKLKTKKNFSLDHDMPPGLSEFLKSKFSDMTLTGQFSVSDIFNDNFDSSVHSYYLKIIAEQDTNMDEFDEENIVDGISFADINFYRKIFLPLSVFYTYQEMHQQTTALRDLMEECFSIGAGSRTMDLFPEVNAYCEVCCPELWNSKFKRLNLLVFKEQVENNFSLPIDTDDDDSEKEFMVKNVEKGSEIGINPFLSDSSSKSSDEDVFGDVNTEPIDTCVHKTFKCSNCPKAFSKEVFLKMHLDIFHDSKRKVTTEIQFVSEPVDLITSFCRDDPPNAKKSKVSRTSLAKVKIRKSLRFGKF